jgi:hypothetical protein
MVWNKKGLMNHIRKIIGLKDPIFNLYAEYEIEDIRSIWFMGKIKEITAIL